MCVFHLPPVAKDLNNEERPLAVILVAFFCWGSESSWAQPRSVTALAMINDDYEYGDDME